MIGFADQASWLVNSGQYLFAAIAAGLSILLGLFILLRSPRNVFSNVLVALMALTAEWNIMASLQWFPGIGPDSWAENLEWIGIAFVPALLFHFSISFINSDAVRKWLSWHVYVISTAFAVVAVLALPDLNYGWFGGDLAMLFDRTNAGDPLLSYNDLYIILLGPALVGAIVLFGVRWVRTPAGRSGVYGCFCVASALAVPFGLIELAYGGDELRISNIGVAIACSVFFWGALRYRLIFDLIYHTREEARGLFADTAHGLLLFGKDGTLTESNDVANRLLGGPPESLAAVDPSLFELAETGGTRYVVRGERVLQVTIVKPKSGVPEDRKTYVVLEDGTREYQLLHELSQRQSLASLGEAAATLAHEIRNPLTAIGVTVENLPGEDASVARIRSEVERLNSLVTRSLSLARALDLDRQPCDLNGLLAKILDRAAMTDRVVLDRGEGIPELNLDPELIGQVVVNLLRNAVDAGADEIAVTTAASGDEVSIRVRNSGPPIPPDVLGRLFQPFVTTKTDGTGLGLAHAKKIVTAHGGEIEAKNVEGGVEFEVRLPWTS
jgi:signal transduction histidine kinase